MCNVVTFRFICQHTLRRRRSRCGGTKHKSTANSTKAACIAESFLTINLCIDCDRCQHIAWEDAWKLKLERANTFFAKLQQRDLPGVEEIAALVKELEEEYVTASWNTRTMFAHGPKPSISRVKHQYYEKAASKLPHEVRPEDVVEKTEKEWTEMDDLDYDGDYEASTDPIHPVSTDYLHPLDDDDGAWILQHLAEADGAELHANDVDFNNGHGWTWVEDECTSNAQSNMNAWPEATMDQADEMISIRSAANTETTLMAWGPEADASISIGKVHLNGRGKGDQDKEKTEELIKSFWSIVNHIGSISEQQLTTTTPPPPPLSSEILPSLLNDLVINESSTYSTPFTPTTPPSTPLRERSLWTDDSSNSPSTPSPFPSNTTFTPDSTKHTTKSELHTLVVRQATQGSEAAQTS
jgi:hypothetical protein